MLNLPYICEPYDDEILGSWLARVALHMGRGAWRRLLDLAGYGKKAEPTCFDFAGYSEQFASLLGILGLSYENALMKLSLLPYWLAFEPRQSPEEHIAGTNNVPTLSRTLSYRRTLISSKTPKWCALCLSEDLRDRGEPYWHREHQLPNVYFCRRHSCPLRSTCPECGFMPTDNGYRTPLPRLRCRCGIDLTSQPAPVQLDACYRRLLEVSHNALVNKIPTWSTQAVRGYLWQEMANRQASPRGRYRTILSTAFKVPGFLDRTKLCLPMKQSDEPIRLKHHFFVSSSIEYCALLAAMNITFAQATAGFLSFRQSKCKVQRRTIQTHTPSNIMEVRRQWMALKGCVKSRSVRDTRLFWILRLFDQVWLERFDARLSRWHVPTLREDQSDILRIANDHSLNPAERTRKLRAQSSAIRAALRDKDWYGKQIRRLAARGVASLRRKSKKQKKELARIVALALHRLSKEERKPEMVTYAKLAALAGTSRHQVEKCMQENENLKRIVQRMNDDKLKRQLIWAGRRLMGSNQPISFRAILRTAGLDGTRGERAFKSEIEAELGIAFPASR